MTLFDNLRLALQWVMDVASGEIIETHDYTRKSLVFDSLGSKWHVAWISNTLNQALRIEGYKLRTFYTETGLTAYYDD